MSLVKSSATYIFDDYVSLGRFVPQFKQRMLGVFMNIVYMNYLQQTPIEKTSRPTTVLNEESAFALYYTDVKQLNIRVTAIGFTFIEVGPLIFSIVL